MTHEHGYGNWSAIKHAARRDTRTRFDHLFMSRSEQELQKRVDILVKSLEKEKESEEKESDEKEKVRKTEAEQMSLYHGIGSKALLGYVVSGSSGQPTFFLLKNLNKNRKCLLCSDQGRGRGGVCG